MVLVPGREVREVAAALVSRLGRHTAGQFLLPQSLEVPAGQPWWLMTAHLRGGTPEAAQPIPERQCPATTIPGVVVESQVLQGRQLGQALGG